MIDTFRHFLFLLLLLISTVFNLVNAQPNKYIPGPVDIDTTKFAHIYFLRELEDEFPNNWLGVIINDDEGLCVKAKMNQIYRVNTILNGKTRFHAKIKDVTEEIILDLVSGKNYYVELKPIKKNNGIIVPMLNILEEKEALIRIKAFPKKIQEQYCIIPLEGDNDFRENVYEERMQWYASKNYNYSFMPLSSWETIIRSPYQTVLGFHNKLISKTYSETGGILYLSNKKFNSEKEFETYCKNKFIETTIDNNKDLIIHFEVKAINVLNEILYANIVNLEISTNSGKSLNENKLTIRSSYVVFFWRDKKGKGNTASLFVSERGLKKELHSFLTLEERILWSWNSFELVEN